MLTLKWKNVERVQDDNERQVQQTKETVSGTSGECARLTCKTEIVVRGDQDDDGKEKDCDMKEDVSCATESNGCNMQKVWFTTPLRDMMFW